MLTFDEVGNRYDLPVYVINDASRYGAEKPLPKHQEGYNGYNVNLTVRSVKCRDTQLTVNTADTVAALKDKFAASSNFSAQNIRLFYNGKELKNEVQIYHYEVNDGIVVQAHVKS